MQFSTAWYYFSRLRALIFSSVCCSPIPSVRVLPLVFRGQFSHAYKTTGKITVLYILSFMLFTAYEKTRCGCGCGCGCSVHVFREAETHSVWYNGRILNVRKRDLLTVPAKYLVIHYALCDY
jgi:hypothetical protein